LATNKSTTKKSTTQKSSTSRKGSAKNKAEVKNTGSEFMTAEVALICFFLLSLLLFLSNFGIIGSLGNALCKFQLGSFGILGYIFPIALFIIALFCLSNLDNAKIWLKVLAMVFVIISVDTIISVISNDAQLGNKVEYLAGGNVGAFFRKILSGVVGNVGTVLIMLAVLAVSVVYISEKSLVNAIKRGSGKVYNNVKEDASIRRLEHTARVEEKRKIRREEAQRKIEGIDFAATDLSSENTTITNFGIEDKDEVGFDQPASVSINVKDEDSFSTPFDNVPVKDPGLFMGNIIKPGDYFSDIEEEDESVPFDDIKIDTDTIRRIKDEDSINYPEHEEESQPIYTSSGKVIDSDMTATQKRMETIKESTELAQTRKEAAEKSRKVKMKPYRIPPMNLLNRSDRGANGGSDDEYKKTAITLQQTLDTFGISVTVTDISCGPTVTRYELHPEVGVKVSRILALQDDLKLALAASSIRIEAPIPGKAAIGIEIPNKETSTVMLRDIFETKDFKETRAKIAFAIGKDIGGAPMVADLAKMPHLLIAGATGSGKSVCINTLILSILYKYSPEDVKMIMIDPKMVELSCYNGIPHLLIPVVTDVKKATGALNWAVAEMEDRYKKFEAIGAKDIKSYNASIDAARTSLLEGEHSDEELPEKMPTIVIIVDELADLMMQCKGEVEPAIVRISQLARAAGMHLVIATQRPSVNVITGLIKANIPSRIALAVTSGVDSRTIIDTVGAERLLGRGDMLYKPQDAPKEIRAQGAYVSEEEIHKVVNYILNENLMPVNVDNNIEKIITGESNENGGTGGERDELFAQAGRYIIDKQKASIGNLQRAFRIGFNRAARIMDQLCDEGVVGPEQGTKPREVLMSEDEFENIL